MLLYLFLFIFGIVAWAIGTLAAGGAVILLMPILPLIISPAEAIPAIALGSFIANPYRAFLFIKDVNWSIGAWMIAGSIIGGIAGSYIFVQLAAENIRLLIGLFLIITALQFWFNFKTQALAMPDWGFMPLATSVSFVSAIIGGAGPVFNPFLAAKSMPKESIIATKAVNTLVMQLSKILGYISFGAFSIKIGGYGLAIGLGALIGVYQGRQLLLKLNNHDFQRIMAVVLFLCGCLLILKSS